MAAERSRWPESQIQSFVFYDGITSGSHCWPLLSFHHKTHKPFSSWVWKSVTTVSQWSLLRDILLTTKCPSSYPPLPLVIKINEIPQMCKDDVKKAQSQEPVRSFILGKARSEHCPTYFNIYEVITSPQEKTRQRKNFFTLAILGA